jgi:rhomboid protease GluP
VTSAAPLPDPASYPRSLPTQGEGDAPQPPPRRPGNLRDRIGRAPVSYGLIAATILVFLAQLLISQTLGADWIAVYGAKVNGRIADGELWRLVTPLFVHANGMHLLVNMYSLSVLGPAIERLFGAPRLLVVYVLAGAAGVELSLAFSAPPSVGASGAIFGLLGALGGVFFLHRRIFGQAGMVQLRHLALVAALNLILGMTPGIDNWAHLGGMLTGLALTFALGPRFEPSLVDGNRLHLVDRRPWRVVRPRAAIASGALLLALVLALQSPLAR